MANSRKSSCSSCLPFYKGGRDGLQRYLADTFLPLVPAGSSITVGLSGGVDSVVLLHLLHRLSSLHPLRLSALHIHHGISRNADAWAEFCSGLCAHLDIPLQVERVDITPLREHGIEAAARKLRHALFERQQTDFVAFAHHADDQAETLLLQLLRGAGVRGTAAMPIVRRTINAPILLRPLLNVPRSELLEYARQHTLQWVEDESNHDDRYPRNFLRQRVLPLLEERFPSYRETLARSARHFAEASELLDELAMQDARLSFPAWRGGGVGLVLEIDCLRSLAPLRAKNVLRYFLHAQGASMPQAVQLDEMLHQLSNAHEDGRVCVEFGGWQLRRYQGFAYVMPALGEFAPDYIVAWSGEAELEWPALGSIMTFTRVKGEGISLERLSAAPVTLRLRAGGETLRPAHAAATRSLKNLLQQHHIPPWYRERLPLLYCGDFLVSVAGVAIAADYQAQAGEAGVVVRCCT